MIEREIRDKIQRHHENKPEAEVYFSSYLEAASKGQSILVEPAD